MLHGIFISPFLHAILVTEMLMNVWVSLGGSREGALDGSEFREFFPERPRFPEIFGAGVRINFFFFFKNHLRNGTVFNVTVLKRHKWQCEQTVDTISIAAVNARPA